MELDKSYKRNMQKMLTCLTAQWRTEKASQREIWRRKGFPPLLINKCSIVCNVLKLDSVGKHKNKTKKNLW
jgi:hypothetical protein